MKIVPQSVEVLNCTTLALQLIEKAGRTCYKSEDRITEKSAEKFVRMIIKRGHDSVLEHASATFRIITDRGISHEIVRHRIGCSYSQESTRYVKYSTGIEFIQPPGLENKYNMQMWKVFCQEAEDAYCRMIGRGFSPQIARSVLPNCLKTEIVMTANFRAWRHFLDLRMDAAAHPQIREVAGMICQWFYAHYPAIVDDLFLEESAK